MMKIIKIMVTVSSKYLQQSIKEKMKIAVFYLFTVKYAFKFEKEGILKPEVL